FLILAASTELRAGEAMGVGALPYLTGSHLQLARRFFTAADGLPGDGIRAVAVTRDGIVLAANDQGGARLQGQRWVRETGPPGAGAMFAPAQGPSALAGASNGIWGLNDGKWQLEAENPANVISFSADPDGVPWALAPSGVGRRDRGWLKIHTIAD